MKAQRIIRTAAVLLALSASRAAEKRPITHEDVWLMKRVGAPAVSPDGKWAVFSVTEPAYDAAKTSSDLWIVPVDGSAPPRRITHSRAAESGAVFSPDSTRIAFTTKREGDEEAQVYVLSLQGGEAQRITHICNGASNPKWRPDGEAILFESRVFPGAMNDEENRRIAAERKGHKYNVRVFDGLAPRQWDHWLDDLRPHIFVQSLREGSAAQDLLAGSKLAAMRGFDGVEGTGEAELEAVWSPDGGSVVFAASVDRDKGTYAPERVQLYQVSGQGEPAALTSGLDSYSHPAFRPDGKALYALQTRNEAETLYSLERLAMTPWPTAHARPKLLSPEWDRSVSSFAFTPDSRRIYITAEDQGHDRVFTVSAAGGTVEPAFEAKSGGYSTVEIPAHATKTEIVALWGSMVHPEDVASIDPVAGGHRLLTAFNRERIEQIDWQAPREFWFTARNGKRIQSLLVLPPGFDANKKYPLVVFPHGGPHNMIKDQFFVRWNYHLLTTPGYVLLMTNYTGSTGYGEAFAAAIHKDILRGPAAEIEQAADEAIRRFPFIDGSRQAAVGASYGGYLMNWFEGNTSRFKCLVNHAGLIDNVSFWGATDGSYYWERRNGGPVWEMKGAWIDQSPSTYAAHFKTPMLITHGERDFRVPINQAFEIYKLLERRQVPCRLVIFPDASHWVLKGEDARQHMKEVLDWLAKYI